MVEKSAQADKLAREVLRVVPALVAERQLEDERLKGLLEQTARARLANYPAALSSFLVHLELGGIPPGWRRRVQLDPLNAITGLPVHEARAFIDAWAEGKLNDETQAMPARPPATVATTSAEATEQRRARRYQQCVDAGLTMPQDTYGHLPRGIGKLAKAEGITRQAFAEDVKAHIERSTGR